MLYHQQVPILIPTSFPLTPGSKILKLLDLSRNCLCHPSSYKTPFTVSLVLTTYVWVKNEHFLWWCQIHTPTFFRNSLYQASRKSLNDGSWLTHFPCHAMPKLYFQRNAIYSYSCTSRERLFSIFLPGHQFTCSLFNYTQSYLKYELYIQYHKLLYC